MIINTINLLIFLAMMCVSLCAGMYMGELRMRDKIHILLEESKRGDRAREALGLHLEYATGGDGSELSRLAGKWREPAA